MGSGLVPAPSSTWRRKAEAGHTRQTLSPAARIHGAHPPDLLREIIRRVQEITDTTMTEQVQEDDLTPKQWRPESDLGGCLTGHIELMVENEQQARRFQELLANLSVEVHQRTIPLLVTGDSLVAGTFRRT